MHLTRYVLWIVPHERLDTDRRLISIPDSHCGERGMYASISTACTRLNDSLWQGNAIMRDL